MVQLYDRRYCQCNGGRVARWVARNHGVSCGHEELLGHAIFGKKAVTLAQSVT